MSKSVRRVYRNIGEIDDESMPQTNPTTLNDAESCRALVRILCVAWRNGAELTPDELRFLRWARNWSKK